MKIQAAKIDGIQCIHCQVVFQEHQAHPKTGCPFDGMTVYHPNVGPEANFREAVVYVDREVL